MEDHLRAILTAAVAQQRYDLVAATAGELVNLLSETGRLRQPLAMVDELERYIRRAGFGPWTQLLARGQRLREQLASLPETSQQEERVDPWNVRELILQAGALAARELGRWQLALGLNGEVTRSQAARDAPALEQARARHNDYGPLLELGRLEELHAALRDSGNQSR